MLAIPCRASSAKIHMAEIRLQRAAIHAEAEKFVESVEEFEEALK